MSKSYSLLCVASDSGSVKCGCGIVEVIPNQALCTMLASQIEGFTLFYTRARLAYGSCRKVSTCLYQRSVMYLIADMAYPMWPCTSTHIVHPSLPTYPTGLKLRKNTNAISIRLIEPRVCLIHVNCEGFLENHSRDNVYAKFGITRIGTSN